MHKALKWVIGAFAVSVGVGCVASALAQPVTNLQPSGNECWNAGQGPGGPSQFLCINQVRNTSGLSVNTIALTNTVVQATTSMNTLAITAQPAASTTINLPANPVADGQVFQVCNVTGSNFATNAAVLTPSSGQSLGVGGNQLTNISLTTLASKTCVEVVFQLSSLTWFQIR